jgi:hypothetical protein
MGAEMVANQSGRWTNVGQLTENVFTNSTVALDRYGHLADSLIGEHDGRSKLERNFHNQVHEPSLKKLIPVIKGLVRFRASERIEASEAINLLDSIS